LVSAGTVFLSDPPLSLKEGGVLDDNFNSYVFIEKVCWTLDGDLFLNRGSSGSFTGASNERIVVSSGTKISSYYMHADRLDDNGLLSGGVSFSDGEVLGLIYRRSELDDSNFLRNSATNYFQGPMESSDGMSLLRFAGNQTVTWSCLFGGHLDQIRIITSC